MRGKNRAVLDGAIAMAREADAAAVLLAAPLPAEADYLRRRLNGERRVIVAIHARSGDGEDAASGALPSESVVRLPRLRLRRRGRAKIALLEGIAAGLVRPGERLVVVSGDSVDGRCELDTAAVVELAPGVDGEGPPPLDLRRRELDPAAFDAVLGLCVRLGHDGKEGQSVGLLVTLGDHRAVLASSRPLVLNPFAGHPEEARNILHSPARRALREFSGMDGAFVVRADGVVVAGGRHLHAVAPRTAVPAGLGTRHRAAAGITEETDAIAFAVSQTSGDVRVFSRGAVVLSISRSD